MLETRCAKQVETGIAAFAATPIEDEDALPRAEVVRLCTQGARHQLVEGAGTTLMLSLQHYTLPVRMLGVNKLTECMAECADDDDEQRAFLQDCLSQLLQQQEVEIRRKLFKIPVRALHPGGAPACVAIPMAAC